MLKCKLCEFYPSKKLSNKAVKHDNDLDKRYKISLQAKLSMHIISTHGMSIEQYVIQTELNGKPPTCKCGLCGERPRFTRGHFVDFAVHHDEFKTIEKLYLKKFGNPQCKKCGGVNVKFNRGRPNDFCSRSCSFSFSLKKLWNTDEYRKKILSKNLKGRLSKVHQRIRAELNLDSIGFKSEKIIDRYVVDEINFDKKIIIEINGDYVHANPKFYQATDVIVLRGAGNIYTAQQKWDYDKKRKELLEALGYRVIIIWESDDLSTFSYLNEIK